MALETASFINGLNVSNPVDSTDQVASLGGHVRLLKNAIKATFPNVSGAVNPTQQELNHLVGVTSGVQAQLDAKATPASLAAAVSAHEAAADPHPGYVTTAEGTALITAHAAASDPHPGYVLNAELLSAVPAQSGHSGKYLTTNGTATFWGVLGGKTIASIGAPVIWGSAVCQGISMVLITFTDATTLTVLVPDGRDVCQG